MRLRSLRASASAPLAQLAALILGAALPLAAQTGASRLPSGVTRVANVEGITEYRLRNGLRVLLFPDATKPTTTINITYLVGSRHEGYGESGMAHLLEHMVFKGSTRHPHIPQELTEHGSRPNGTTSYDRTNYFETVPATDANVDWALDLEADRMVNSFIARKDLESEFSVVRNEFESGENHPDWVLADRVMATAYLWHAYGRSVVGSKEDIERVPVDRLQSFYRRYYQPDNAVLVVAGKFEPARVLSVVQQKFGAIPAPARSAERGNVLYPTYTTEPAQDGEREAVLRRVGDAPTVMAGYHVVAGSHPDFAAIDVLASILGDAPSGRLYRSLVDTKLAASVYAWTYQLREPGFLMTQADLRKGVPVDSTRAALLRALDAAVTTPVTDEEVARARTKLLSQLELTVANSEDVGFYLTEWAAMGDWRLLFLYRDQLQKVTAADVHRVAAAYLKPSNRTVGAFIPTAAPDRSLIAAAPAPDVLVGNYVGHAVVQAGEAFDASPKAVDARTSRGALPVGMRLTYLPKRTRGSLVHAQITLRYGTAATLNGRSAAAEMMAELLSRGTVQLTRQQVQDSLDHLKAQVFLYGGAGNVNASVETMRAQLVPTLRLIASELRTPRFDAAEFEKARQERLASLEQRRSDPQSIAFTAAQRRLAPYPKGDPRYVRTIDEQIAELEALTLDQVRTLHTSLVGASAADIAIVGDVDTTAVTAMLREALGGWASPAPYERPVRTVATTDSSSQVIETPDKANAVLVGGLSLPIRDDDPDAPALMLTNFMLGGGFLNSRIATRLRQQEGMSYGAGSFLSTSSMDHVSNLMWYAIYNPENVNRLVSALREEVEKVHTAGFTEAELVAAKPGLLQQRLQVRSNDRELAGLLVSRREAARTLAFDEDLERRVNALTLAQVNAVARKYLDPSQAVLVRAGDFSGKPPVASKP